jgi:hypothetical protein
VKDENAWHQSELLYAFKNGVKVRVVRWVPKEGYGLSKPEYFAADGTGDFLLDRNGDGSVLIIDGENLTPVP